MHSNRDIRESMNESSSPPSSWSPPPGAILNLHMGNTMFSSVRRITADKLVDEQGRLSYQKVLLWCIRYSPSFIKDEGDDVMATLETSKDVSGGRWEVETTYLDEVGDRVRFANDEELAEAFLQAERRLPIEVGGNSLSAKNWSSSNPNSSTQIRSSMPRRPVVLQCWVEVTDKTQPHVEKDASFLAMHIPNGLRSRCQSPSLRGSAHALRSWLTPPANNKRRRGGMADVNRAAGVPNVHRQLQAFLENFVCMLAKVMMTLQEHLDAAQANANRLDDIESGRFKTCRSVKGKRSTSCGASETGRDGGAGAHVVTAVAKEEPNSNARDDAEAAAVAKADVETKKRAAEADSMDEHRAREVAARLVKEVMERQRAVRAAVAGATTAVVDGAISKVEATRKHDDTPVVKAPIEHVGMPSDGNSSSVPVMDEKRSARDLLERLMAELTAHIQKRQGGSETTADVSTSVATAEGNMAQKAEGQQKGLKKSENSPSVDVGSSEVDVLKGFDPSFVHLMHGCDGCKKAPIVGIRYHATNMKNFDLCSSCMASYTGKGVFQPEQLDRDLRFQSRRSVKRSDTPSQFIPSLLEHARMTSKLKKESDEVGGKLEGSEPLPTEPRKSAVARKLPTKRSVVSSAAVVDVVEEKVLMSAPVVHSESCPKPVDDKSTKVWESIDTTLERCVLSVGGLVHNVVEGGVVVGQKTAAAAAVAAEGSKKRAAVVALTVTEVAKRAAHNAVESTKRVAEAEFKSAGQEPTLKRGTNAAVPSDDAKGSEPSAMDNGRNASISGENSEDSSDDASSKVDVVSSEGKNAVDPKESIVSVDASDSSVVMNDETTEAVSVESPIVEVEEDDEASASISLTTCSIENLEKHSAEEEDVAEQKGIEIALAEGEIIVDSGNDNSTSVPIEEGPSEDEWDVVVSDSKSSHENELARATVMIGSALFREDVSRSAEALSSEAIVICPSEDEMDVICPSDEELDVICPSEDEFDMIHQSEDDELNTALSRTSSCASLASSMSMVSAVSSDSSLSMISSVSVISVASSVPSVTSAARSEFEVVETDINVAL